MLSSEDKKTINNLCNCLGVSQEIASLLFARGYKDYDSAYKFLHPDIDDLTSPFSFDGMDKAAEVLKKHIDNKSPITVYGDYDCDGIGASAILYLAIKNAGGVVNTFIPSRQEDGYGLSFDALNRVIEGQNPALIITVDCGISSVKEVEYAKSQGIEFIVTDHHEPQTVIPDCIVVDPKLNRALPELCGAGVAIKLVEAFAGRGEALKYMDICAVSTIADLVPLVGDNRIIASYGLKMLGATSVRYGFRALLKAAGCEIGEPVDSYCVSFKLAPRLNASGRLSSAEKSLKLLTSDDRTLVNLIAAELDAENRTRQALCQDIYADALKMLTNYDLDNSRIIVLYNEEWEGGVVGIAATKIAQEFNRPTILCTKKDDIIRGSGRSITGVNLHDAISYAKDYLIQFGGHSMAAGLSVKPENLPSFIKAVNEYLYEYADEKAYEPNFPYDSLLRLEDIDLKFMRELVAFEPYGMANPKPVFMQELNACDFSRLSAHNHIKYTGGKDVSAIGFNLLWRLNAMRSDMPKRIFYTVEKEVFRGKESVKAFLKYVQVLKVYPCEDVLIERYFDKYLPLPVREKGGVKNSLSASYGRLILCFSKKSFEKACEEYPSYYCQFERLPSLNPYNAILLAPDSEADFSYYSEIAVYDKIPDVYKSYLLNTYAAEFSFSEEEPEFDTLNAPDIDVLRTAYVLINKASKSGKLYSLSDVFKAAKTLGFKYGYPEFIVCYLILQELGLICFDERGIIYTINRATEPTNSLILDKVWSLCRNRKS